MVADPATRLRMLGVLAQAAGSRGMVGGQAIDLAAVGQELGLAELENMHIHKTGALIRASVLLGALSQPKVEPAVLEQLDTFACEIHQLRTLLAEGNERTLAKSLLQTHDLRSAWKRSAV